MHEMQQKQCLAGLLIALNAYIRQKGSKFNHLKFHLRKIEKEDQSKQNKRSKNKSRNQ